MRLLLCFFFGVCTSTLALALTLALTNYAYTQEYADLKRNTSANGKRSSTVHTMLYSTQANSMLIGPFRFFLEWTNQHWEIRSSHVGEGLLYVNH